MLAEQAGAGRVEAGRNGKYYLARCPLTSHAHPKRGDVVIMPGGGTHCIKCGETISPAQMVAGYRGGSVDDAWQWINRQLGRPDRRRDWQPASPTVDLSSNPRPYDVDNADLVYRVLLEELGLAECHQQFEARRGQTAAQMIALGYATLPAGMGKEDARGQAVARVIARVGEAAVAKVPGFFKRYGYWNVAGAGGKQGRLIPVRNAAGRIARLQVNPDVVEVGAAKYLYIAAGAGTPGAAHIVNPPGEFASDPRIWLTEGPRKADIASPRLDAVMIASCGGSDRKAAIHALLDHCGSDRPPVVLAYDIDEAGRGSERRKGFTEQMACDLAALDFPLFVAEWNGTTAKGIDDALLQGLKITTRRYRHKGRKGLAAIETDTIARVLVAVEPERMYTLEEARAANYTTIRALLDSYAEEDTSQRGRVVVLSSTTGTGKTTAAITALADRWQAGWPEVTRTRRRQATGEEYTARALLRVIVAVEQREQVAEWIARLAAHGVPAVPLIGRVAPTDTELAATWPGAVCELAKEAEQLAKRGHSAGLVCGPKGEPHNCEHQQTVSSLLSDDPAAAPIVIATKAALFKGRDRLANFDLLICDEGLEGQMHDPIRLDNDALRDWLIAMDRHSDHYPVGCPQRALHGALTVAVAGAPMEAAPLLEHLKVNIPNIVRLLEACAAEQPVKLQGGGEGCLLLEAVCYVEEVGTRRKLIPPRYWSELVKVLSDELAGGDHLLWLKTRPAVLDGKAVQAGAIIYQRPRRKLISRLTPDGSGRKCDAIILDATPGPLLTNLLPHTKIKNFAVPQHTHAVQTTDALYTSNGLAARDSAAATKLGKLANVLATPNLSTGVIGHKRFMGAGGAITVNLEADGVDAGWYGNDDRAHNRWEDVHALIVVGHFQLPPDEAMMMAAMIRHVRGEAAPTKAESVQVLRPYTYADPATGMGAGWWTKVAADPLSSKIALHSEQATLWQAIGRARAATRNPLSPVIVYLLTATPVAGLKVDRLATVDELLEEAGLLDTWAIEKKRANIKATAEQKKQEAAAKIEAAYNAGARGVRPLARAAGVSPNTVQAWAKRKGGDERCIKHAALIYICNVCDTASISPIPPNVVLLAVITPLISGMVEPTPQPAPTSKPRRSPHSRAPRAPSPGGPAYQPASLTVRSTS